MKSNLAKILLIIIGVFFILSAVAKLFPVIQFEFLLGSFSLPWSWTPYIARTIIGVELVLGILLLLRFRLHRLAIPLSIRFLIFMTLVLVYRWMTAGADAECGCMGDWLSMTPLQSILKNIALIGALFWMKKNIAPSHSISNNYILLSIAIVSFVLPYIIEPVYVGLNTTRDQQETYPFDVDLLYADNQKELPKIDVRKGKHIVAFLSVNCPHCKLAAKKIAIIYQLHPEIPFYFFINGKDENIAKFCSEQKCESVPYSKLLQPQFLQLAGPELPSIQFLEDGQVVRNVDYLDLDVKSMEDFLK